MKKLILIRHGKSTWEYPVRDHDRVLMQRGIMDGHRIGAYLKEKGVQPDVSWTSTAARALQTATIIGEHIDYNLKNLQLKRDLYTFDANDLIRIIKSCPDTVQTLMVFSHNHGLTEAVNAISDHRFDNVPTTGVVAIDFDTNMWATIANGSVDFHIFPKEL